MLPKPLLRVSSCVSGLLAIVTFTVYVCSTAVGRIVIVPWGWVFIGCVSVVLFLVAFGPTLIRRYRGMPRVDPMSTADIRFTLLLIAVLVPLTILLIPLSTVYSAGIIMSVPFAFQARQ